MKQQLKLSFFVAIALVTMSFFSSCNKDNKGDALTTLLNIPGATYSEKALPKAKGSNKAVIQSIQSNNSIIPGGGAPLRIEYSGSADQLLIKAVDYSGHFILDFTPNSSGLYSATAFTALISQNATAGDVITFRVALTDGETVSEYEEVEVTVLEVGTGRLQVSLSFDQSTDLDLYLVEPDGETIYYGNSASANGGLLDLDSNPACYQDNVNNENITYDDQAEIEAGQYTVRVNNYADCVGVKVNYTVTAYLNGSLVDTYNGFFEADTATPGGEDAGQEVFQFNVSSAQAGSRTMSSRVASFK